MYSFFKRIIDFTASLGVLILVSPIMLITAVIIYLQDFHNPIFSHYRVGKDGKEFKFYKFRSMPVETPNVESHEKDKLTIKVLLDKSKIDIYQLFYRLHLIIDSEMDEITHEASKETIMFYEREIDRLYHLSTKIIKMSLVDTNVLASSKIENRRK